ncbi:hypothetical protein Dsin_003461 [Dipteronia sinensis]|uniref:Reverse transcriptase n=1 Tax=Dipteronia sinensis TaxID=43782 RepID=A0AAE0EM71_9ROSI|nr:hypothetical protein Dsin_003461 [Dipteronia sinensis]
MIACFVLGLRKWIVVLLKRPWTLMPAPQLVECHDRYLGLPSFAGKNKRKLFASIRGRVWDRVRGWQNKLFSAGSKEILVKAVIQAISTYSMFLFRLLKRDLLEVGSRWRIGRGDSVSIYHDRWIPRPITFKVVSPSMLGDDAKVAELKLLNGSWNEQLIHDSFLPEDVSLILNIPCLSSQLPDSISWHYDKLGLYSVKSGYHIGCNSLAIPGLFGLSSSEA